MKRVFGVIAFISFFMMLGFVGALEQDMVSLGIGTVRMFAALGAFALFTWLADGFKPYKN